MLTPNGETPGRRSERSPLTRLGRWPITAGGEENPGAPEPATQGEHGVQMRTPMSPDFLPTHPPSRSMRPVSAPHTCDPNLDPRSARSLPASHSRDTHIDPRFETELHSEFLNRRRCTPPGVMPPDTTPGTGDPTMGTGMLRRDLAQIDEVCRTSHQHNLHPIANEPRTSSAAGIDGDEFADSCSGDDLDGASEIQSGVSHDGPKSSTESARDDTGSPVNPHIPSTEVRMSGKRTLIAPSVEGFDHPLPRNKAFDHQDCSTATGQHPFCAIKEGWERTVASSCAAAWVRTADHKQHTRCAQCPQGIAPVCQGFSTHAEAVRFLGWDPSVTSGPDRGLDPKPPPRPAECESQKDVLNVGADPHDWCGTHTMTASIDFFEDGDDLQSEMSSLSPESAKPTEAESVAQLTAALARKIQAQTNDAMARADDPTCRAAKKEEAARLILAKLTHTCLPGLPEDPTVDALHDWPMMISGVLAAPHWCSPEGVSILLGDDDADNDDNFRHRSAALSRLLVGRLTADKHVLVLDEFADHIANGHGVSLLRHTQKFSDTQTDQTALKGHCNFREIVQKNGETVKATARTIRQAHVRLKTAGFPFGDGDDLQLFQTLTAVSRGAHAQCACFVAFRQDVIQGRHSLKTATFEDLVAHLHQISVSEGLVIGGKGKDMGPTKARRTIGGDSSPPSGSAPPSGGCADPWFGQTCLDELSSRAQWSLTKCPHCRCPHNDPRSHWIDKCPRLKQCGHEITCNQDEDQRLDKFNKPTDSEKISRAQRRREEKKARAAKSSTDSKDGTTDGEPQDNPRPPTPPAGRRVTAPEDETADDDDRHFSFMVDAHDNIDTNSGICFPFLSECDHVTPAGRRIRCVGRTNHRMRCRIAARRTKVAWHSDSACMDTGAAADMLNHRRHFGTDYRKTSDVVVHMGDGTPARVHGRGTARIKIDGKVINPPDALHIPSLDCSLLSVTQHALRGQGCGFFAQDGKCTMAFPTFTMSRKIPCNGDPMLALQTLNPEDHTSADYDGTCGPNALNTFRGRLAFLRRAFKGRQITTRGQKKKFLQHPKSLLHSGKQHEESLRDIGEALNKSHSKTPVDTVVSKKRADNLVVPSPPNHAIAESAKGSSPDRFSRYELETMFGGRRLKDCSILSQLGTGLRIANKCDDVQTVGKLVNVHKGRRRRSTDQTVSAPLDLVGMDIGHGVPNGPGGHEHCLVLVDKCTSCTWVFGMHGTSGHDAQEALWKFFLDAGGFPKAIQCDFDPRFIGGKAAKLLRAHGCRIRAAPPNRQSQNGLVERRWQTLEQMARTCLANAKLPKRFWFWAVREAARRLSILPVATDPEDRHNPDHMIAPFEAFHSAKPDYRALFPFGCVGTFRRPRDGSTSRNSFNSQGLLGIALGRSEFTDGMIFHNPILDSFCTSADHRLDPHQSIPEHFPSIVHDGGLTTSVVSSQDKSPCKFNTNDTVCAKYETNDDIDEGAVVTPPTGLAPQHTVQLETGTAIAADAKCLHPEGCNPESTPSVALGFFTPDWLKQDCKATLLHDDTHKRGCLALDPDNDWQFVTRNRSGTVADRVPSLDLHCSWKHRLQENTLILGWQEHVARRCCGIGRHVSAANPQANIAPSNLLRGLAEENPDAEVWNDACNEECDGLRGFETFVEMSEAECQAPLAKHGNTCEATPTMNVFAIEKDKEGRPVRAKSRIAALGNLERRIWDKAERHAPAMSASSNRLLISMAVQDGRIMKQGDCKNAFCQPSSPEDETTIVLPPKGCPRSRPGTHWKLQKTLCGLARSPRHWHERFSTVLKDELKFESMPHDHCVFECAPLEGEPPICVGCCVDDFIHCSQSDAVEEWFETNLSSRMRVDFMGAVSWFPGCACDWSHSGDGRLACHISQQACVEGLAEKFGLEVASPTDAPCRSGCVIDRIPCDDKSPDDKPKLVKEFQSMMGGLSWLSASTRPDISVANDLLGRFNANPSKGHLDGAKHASKHLKTTASHGIRFTQGHNPLRGHVSFPPDLDIDETAVWTDANWGPQDASKPKPNDTRTVDMEEMHSLGGHHVTGMGGPMSWGVVREKRISGSSCEAEIKAMDAGTKEMQILRHPMVEMGLMSETHTIPLMNDNSGATEWSKTGGPASKKSRHMNLKELRVAECQHHGEIKCLWAPGKENPSDLLTKEHSDKAHCKKLRDFVLCPCEVTDVDGECRRNGSAAACVITDPPDQVAMGGAGINPALFRGRHCQ